MAITNTQQARQMYNEGSKKPVTQAGVKNFLGKQEMVTAPKFWLSEPDHVKAKLAYITDEEEKILIDKNLYGSLKGKPNKGPAGLPSLQGGDFGSEGAGTGDSAGGGDPGGTGKGRDLDFQQRGMTKGDYATGRGAGPGGDRSQNFGGRSKFSALDFIPGIGTVRRLSKFFKGAPTRGFNPATRDGAGRDQMPLWMQLGYSSEAEYNRAMGGGIMNPAAIQPQQTLDLNRIAYRFMADGGFLEDTDEARQAYGLGSIVKKAFKTVRKPFKAVTKTLKKVAKSPTGRLLLAVAAPYALGPAVASSAALSGLTAAQQAALISGATTGISQLASGEDLDLKDIALSAAIGGTSAKFFPPGGAPKADPTGVAGKARVASDISAGAIPDRAMGQIASRAPTFTGAAEYGITTRPVKTLSLPSSRDFAKIPSARTPDANIFTRIKEGLGNIKDSKVLQFMKDNPTLSILGASGIAGLMAKKDFEEDEFTDQDRGPGIDIAAIRRRPFDYMAPRFAGSQFDFYDTAAADGGRIGFDDGDTDLSNDPGYKGWVKIYETNPDAAAMNENHERYLNFYERTKNAQAEGSKEPVAKKVMPLLDLDGQEMDLRAEGGFVPIGRMEKADDVPARLSKNEFVFTADAVRNAGDGDVDKGAEVMYNMMKNLESGGDVSEESQGLKGARQMFQTSQRLEEVL